MPRAPGPGHPLRNEGDFPFWRDRLMKPYASWKYVVLVFALIFGALYSAPNLYGDDPSVQVSMESGDPLPADFGESVAKALASDQITPISSGFEQTTWVVRLPSTETQLHASEVLKRELGRGYVVALNAA